MSERDNSVQREGAKLDEVQPYRRNYTPREEVIPMASKVPSDFYKRRRYSDDATR